MIAHSVARRGRAIAGIGLVSAVGLLGVALWAGAPASVRPGGVNPIGGTAGSQTGADSVATKPSDKALPLPPQVACERAEMPAGGRVFYVDPVRGSDGGDGSREHPWRSLQTLVAKRMLGDRLRLGFRGPAGADGKRPAPVFTESANPRAQVVGGDTILLASGSYGDLVLNGVVNRKFVTIAAAPGARPVFTRIAASYASHLILRGLVVAGPLAEHASGFLVGATPQDAFIPDNLVFDDMTVGGTQPIAGHDSSDWAKRASNGVLMRGDCMTLSNSHIHDIRSGVAIMQGRDDKVLNNRIAGFSDDGIDFSGDRLRLQGNWITDHWNNDASLHPDCMQGQSSNWHQPYADLRIEGNVCIDRTTARPAQPKEYLQGISMFDGTWRDITINCNIILPRAYHGIALYGMDDVRIENNVVLSTDPKYPSWIVAQYSKFNKAPRNNVIQGNLSTGFPNANPGKTGDLARLERSSVRGAKVSGDDVPGVRLIDNTLAVWPGVKVSPQIAALLKVKTMAGVVPPMTVAEALKRFTLPAACSVRS